MFKVTKSQILHLLSGLIFTPVAGFVTAWVAAHFPGLPHFTSEEVTAFFVSGASVGLGLAIHYLHGWQLWEKTVGKVIDVEDTVKPHLVTPVPRPPAA